MRIIINGYGKMGKTVEKSLNDFPNITNFVIKDKENTDFNLNNKKYDFLIDFSSVEGFNWALNFCEKNKIPFISGTTGLLEKDFILLKKASKEIPIFYSPNMSEALNLTFYLSKILAQNLNFDIHLIETHHKTKKDIPSGTALKYKEFIKEAKKDISISSARIGNIIGEHKLTFAGKDEKIILEHNAFSRDIFAIGAIKAGLWLIKQKNGLYNFSNIFKLKI